jgi:hypothetical protein
MARIFCCTLITSSVPSHYLQVYIIYYCELRHTSSSELCSTAPKAMPQQQAVLLLFDAQSTKCIVFRSTSCARSAHHWPVITALTGHQSIAAVAQAAAARGTHSLCCANQLFCFLQPCMDTLLLWQRL